MRFKTGLLPAPHPPALRFGSYFMPSRLPAVPAVFGHQNLFTTRGWGMLANDKLGCCTVSGAMHCIMLFNKISGKTVHFTDLDVADDYYAITGGPDSGADMVKVAEYWQTTGFRDNRDIRHHIVAYVGVNASNLDQVFAAAYMFDAVGLGIQIRESDEEDFIFGQPWRPHSDDVIGFHYVPLIARLANGNAGVVTWGGFQEVEMAWLGTNVKEVVAMISFEALTNGKSAEGFDLEALQDDLDAIKDPDA